MSQAHAHAEHEEMDPHGFQGAGHGDHVIVGWRILVGVLAALLFFTALTTTAATVEEWVGVEFGIMIPHWINVGGALTIAVIKASLVCLFFMQLRYDKPLNGIILLFCLLTLAIFLGLTALDLGARDRIYAFKRGTIDPGGNAMSAGMTGGRADIGPRPQTMGKGMVAYARQKYIDEHGEEKWSERFAYFTGGHGAHGHDGPELSSAGRSIPRTGVTPHLYDRHDPAAVRALEQLRSGGHAPESDEQGGESSSGGH